MQATLIPLGSSGTFHTLHHRSRRGTEIIPKFPSILGEVTETSKLALILFSSQSCTGILSLAQLS